jgi:hypothetical protein
MKLVLNKMHWNLETTTKICTSRNKNKKNQLMMVVEEDQKRVLQLAVCR